MPSVNLPHPAQPATYVAGTLIAGKYELEKPLGFGGMGTVWLARNVTLDSPVALKLIRPEVRGVEAVARLLTEARVEANLNHPGIVRVFDFGQTAGGDSFIVMEPLEGRSLGDVLEAEGRLRPLLAVQLMLPVIDALCCAHLHGVVHRDLKPDNIFITTVDQHRVRPKLLDFGIAKLIEGRARHLHKVTPGGTLMGSPAYMAPEQARGEVDTDVRADVWSLCVVLYETVSGRPAFKGDNYNALLRAVVEDAITPLVDELGGEAQLWQILRHGLEKPRNRRFASMRELGNALAAWLSQHGVDEDICGQPLERAWQPRPPALEAAGPARVVKRAPIAAVAQPEGKTTARRKHLPGFQNAATVDASLAPVSGARRSAARTLPRATWTVLAAVAGLGVLSVGATLGAGLHAPAAEPTRRRAAHIVRPAPPAAISSTPASLHDAGVVRAARLAPLATPIEPVRRAQAQARPSPRRPSARVSALELGLKDPYR